MKGGKQIKSQYMPIDDSTSIQNLDEESAYKYFGVTVGEPYPSATFSQGGIRSLHINRRQRVNQWRICEIEQSVVVDFCSNKRLFYIKLIDLVVESF